MTNKKIVTVWVALSILFVCCLLNGIELFVGGASASPFLMEDTPEATGRLPTVFTRTVCPTRNMSYDLRKTMPIKRTEWPILNSTIGPLNPNKCISHGIDDI
jgi:hypothetical protein